MPPHAQPEAPRSAQPSSARPLSHGLARGPHDGPAGDLADVLAADPERARLCDLSRRWHRARVAALRATLAPLSTQGGGGGEAGESEATLAQRALALDEDATLRRVFDNSLHLGVGYARTFGVVDVDALGPLVAGLELDCLAEAKLTKLDDEEGFVLERPGCPHGACGGEQARRACDLTREAIGGLALGLTGVVRHARHESLGHGASRCLDLFYTDPESPRRLGTVPAALAPALEAVAASARLFDPSATVAFLGLSEDVLFYRIERPGAPCEGSDVDVRRFVVRAAARRLPQLTLVELTPASPMDRDAEKHEHGHGHGHGHTHEHGHAESDPHAHPHAHPHAPPHAHASGHPHGHDHADDRADEPAREG